jgi:hypothetical protein
MYLFLVISRTTASKRKRLNLNHRFKGISIRGEGLLIANDKIKLYRYMSDKGFTLREFRIISKIDDFETACKEIGYRKAYMRMK